MAIQSFGATDAFSEDEWNGTVIQEYHSKRAVFTICHINGLVCKGDNPQILAEHESNILLCRLWFASGKKASITNGYNV